MKTRLSARFFNISNNARYSINTQASINITQLTKNHLEKTPPPPTTPFSKKTHTPKIKRVYLSAHPKKEKKEKRLHKVYALLLCNII